MKNKILKEVHKINRRNLELEFELKKISHKMKMIEICHSLHQEHGIALSIR